MSQTRDTGVATEESLKPIDTARRKSTVELTRFAGLGLEVKDQQARERTGSFLQTRLVERLKGKLPELSDDVLASILEGINLCQIRIDKSNGNAGKNVSVAEVLPTGLDQNVKKVLITEITRIAALTEICSGGGTDTSRLYAALELGDAQISDGYDGSKIVSDQKMLQARNTFEGGQRYLEVVGKLAEVDPDFFADSIVANLANTQMKGWGADVTKLAREKTGGPNPYLYQIDTLTGLPYRDGKKDQDLEAVREAVAKYESPDQLPKTHQELSEEVGSLRNSLDFSKREADTTLRSLDAQRNENAGLKAKLLEAEALIAELKGKVATAETNDGAVAKKVAEAEQAANVGLEKPGMAGGGAKDALKKVLEILGRMKG